MRIYITTEVNPKFPITLLQMSTKFTNEPPQGMKAGLKRTYAGVTQEQVSVTWLGMCKVFKLMMFKVIPFGCFFDISTACL